VLRRRGGKGKDYDYLPALRQERWNGVFVSVRRETARRSSRKKDVALVRQDECKSRVVRLSKARPSSDLTGGKKKPAARLLERKEGLARAAFTPEPPREVQVVFPGSLSPIAA